MTKKITDIEIARIAKEEGFQEDILRAVLEVESAGRGFDSKGRLRILFEPHIFYREINAPSIRAQAVQAGLAYRNWGTSRYPKDPYDWFNPAFKLDPIAAMKSASVGLGQIMGFNHVAAGFDSVGAMWESFKVSEANQLRGMVRFIISEGLDDELRAKDWRAFARGYNGPAYEKNKYHTKLAAAYDKWVKIPDIKV